MWKTRRDFEALAGLIGAHFHQDMDMEYASVAAATGGYAREAGNAEKEQLFRDMDDFLKRYADNLKAEFEKRFSPDLDLFTDQTVPEFFGMVRAILADPECYRKFE